MSKMKLSLLKLVTLISLILVGMGNVFAQQYEILGLLPTYDYPEYFEENELKLNDKSEAVIGSFYIGENRGSLDYRYTSQVPGYSLLSNITSDGKLVGTDNYYTDRYFVHKSQRIGADFINYVGGSGSELDSPVFALDQNNAVGTCYGGGVYYLYFYSSACGYVNGSLQYFNLSLSENGEDQRYILSYLQSANAINSSGEVVGQAVKNYDPSKYYPDDANYNQYRAFSWTQGAGIEDLGTLGGKHSYAIDINDQGTIIGYADKFTREDNYDPERSFYKRRGEPLKEITINGQLDSRAYAINAAGIIVGRVRYDEYNSQAYMFSGENNFSLLKNLVHPAYKNTNLQSASDINNAGEIIGKTDTFPYNAYLARVLPSSLKPVPFTGGRDVVGTADYMVWRPGNGTWYSLRPKYSASAGKYTFDASDVLVRQWGLKGDVPIFNADFDGDKLDDLAVWRPSTGMWYICSSSTSYNCSNPVVQQFGLPGDIPLISDFDKDGKSDFVIYRRSLPSAGIVGTWYVKRSSDSVVLSQQWGLQEDLPIPGDYNGDGFSDFAVYRPSSASWFVLYSNQQAGNANFMFKRFGLPKDHPMPRDVDADGLMDLVLYRPETANWFSCLSSRQFKCFKDDSSLTVPPYQFGISGDYPLLRNTIGGSSVPYAVWRKKGVNNFEGTWYTDLPVGLEEDGLKIKNWGLLGDVPAGVGIRDLVERFMPKVKK